MKFIRYVVVAAALAAILAASAAHAQGTCQKFPQVTWWGKLSHDRVARYVARKHDGDWLPYIVKWERQMAKVENVYRRNSRLVIRKRGIVIEGEALGGYLQKIRKRVAINRCLAHQAARSAALDAGTIKEPS
jgi:hypothetical protein